MKTKKYILVTGAAGFIGYHLSKSLIKHGHYVIGLDNINDYYDVNLKYARLNNLGITRLKAQRFDKIILSEIFFRESRFIYKVKYKWIF